MYKQLTNLDSLVDVETAAKILLGAVHKLNEYHPLEYCYFSLGVKMEVLEKGGKEFKYLFQYLNNTSGGNTFYRLKPDEV